MVYGATNRRGEIASGEIGRILAECRSCGVLELDTAQVYGRAEEKLGQAGVADFGVTTKIRLSAEEGAEDVGRKARESLARLNLEQVSALLLHNEERLAGSDASDIVAALRFLQKSHCAERIGVSSYDPLRALAWCQKFGLDLVQLPANALDSRLFHDDLLGRFLENGTQVQVRSVFLQGILLGDPVVPGKVPPAALVAAGRFREKCRAEGMDPLAGALGHVLGQGKGTKIVLGVSTLEELRQVLDALPSARALADPPSFPWQREWDPRTWPA